MTFSLDRKEKRRFSNFKNIHKKCKFDSAIGGKIGITFIPTSICCITQCTCFSCKESRDVTNYSVV